MPRRCLGPVIFPQRKTLLLRQGYPIANGVIEGACRHVVKDRLMARFPQIGDAIIHIEPPPRDDDPREQG